jgi:pyruvate,water dikinase
MQRALPAFAQGFAETAKRYGWLIAGVDMRPVNGFLYTAIVPLDGDEFGERIATAETVFEQKMWRDDVARWNKQVKPAALAAHRTFIEMEPGALDDTGLVVHLRECARHHWSMWLQHHQMNGPSMIAVADFMVGALSWTGLPAARLAQALRGASPISAGSCPETTALASAIAADGVATGLLFSDEEASVILDGLAARTGVGDVFAAWILVTGHRISGGFDLTSPTALEQPSMLLACLRAAVTALSEGSAGSAAAESVVADVRAHVPEEHRSDFDDRLAEARHCAHVRDERGIYSDATAAGILRRAMLAAGRRLERRAILVDADLALDATVDELADLLLGERGADAVVASLAERARLRRRLTLADAPRALGPPPGEPPGFDGLPSGAARVMKAITGLRMEAPPTSSADENLDVLAGIAASPGVHRGMVRIVSSPDDFGRLEPGDVLVTVTTGESFNVAIALTSALVTDTGAVMCHAAITAREFGIPCVVGTHDATIRLRDGDVVEVDGDAGVVRRIGASSR